MAVEDEHRAALETGLKELNIPCNEQQLQQLLEYCSLLRKWNKVYNLVGDLDGRSLIYRHLLDSLAIQPYLRGNTILDVGTGAGLPGIPLAIVNPDRQFILLDSNGKKTRFLFQVRTVLKLENISVENCRVEHYQSTEQIDIVLCRAFSSLRSTINATKHLILNEKSSFFALKGRYPEEELGDLPDGFELINANILSIPGSDTERHLLELRRRASSQTGQAS